MNYDSFCIIRACLSNAILTTINDDCLPGDKCRIITRQKKHCTSNILRFSQPLDRLLFHVSRFCSSDCGAIASVFVRPGNTEFAVMPSFATSFAKPLMNPMIPIFVVM